MFDEATCRPAQISVVVQNPIYVQVAEQVQLPVVKVQVPGIQGPASVDRPLEVDPLQTYLEARGAFNNGNDSQYSDQRSGNASRN